MGMVEDINVSASSETNSRNVNKYNVDDSANLFKVFVQKNTDSDDSAISAMKVAEIVHRITNGKHIDEIKKVSRKRVIVVCTKAEAANRLVENEEIKNKGLSAYIPLFLTSRVAVIKDVDIEYSNELLQDVIDSKQFKIKSITRLTRRTMQDGQLVYEPTRSVKIIFEGQNMPTYVYVWKLRFQCVPFVRKTKQSYKCLRYGHIADHCNSKYSRCINCGCIDHSSENCPKVQIMCVNCKLNHSALDKICPERKRQSDINELMAFQNMSYQEAALEIPSRFQLENSYAVRTGNRFDIFSDIDDEFPELTPSFKHQLPTYHPPPISRHGKREIMKVDKQKSKDTNYSNRTHTKRTRSDTMTSSDMDYNNLTRLSLSHNSTKQRKIENHPKTVNSHSKIGTTEVQVHLPVASVSGGIVQPVTNLTGSAKQIQDLDEIIYLNEDKNENRKGNYNQTRVSEIKENEEMRSNQVEETKRKPGRPSRNRSK